VSRDEIIQAGIEAGRRHRRERGLPETVTDPATLAQLASMLRPVPQSKPAAARQR